MKKLSIALVFLFSTVLWAADSRVEANNILADILKPYNSQVGTKAEAAFEQLEMSAKNLLLGKLHLGYWKQGPANTVYLNIGLKYENPLHDTYPTTDINAHVNLDLVKAFGWQKINGFAKDIEQTIGDTLADMKNDYKGALNADAKVIEKVLDPNGNLMRLKYMIHLDVDLDKLPANKPKQEELAKQIDVIVQFDPNNFLVDASLVHNKGYKGYLSDTDWLKTKIDKFLNKDADTIKNIEDALKNLDDFAAQITSNPKQ